MLAAAPVALGLSAEGDQRADLRKVIRLTYAMVDTYCANYRRAPTAVTLDIDDTLDVVHGYQQMSLFNAHYDERLVRFATQLHADPCP